MDNKPIKVLLIEDNPGDARLIYEMLAEAGSTKFQLETCDRLSTGLGILASNEIDVSLLDLSLPDAQGLDTFIRAHAAAPTVPVVVLTGTNDEEFALKAVGEGAQDYLVKGQVDSNLLIRAIRHAIERRRLIEELEQAQAQQLQLKDQFLSHVSHELRSPLTAIYQFVTILKDGLAGELNQEQSEYIDITLRNVKQLRSMIDDLLQVTRAEVGKLSVEPQRTFINNPVLETITSLRASSTAKSIIMTADLPTDLPPAYVDPARIKQVLTNLIENAIKFTPENGTIMVRGRVFNDDPNFLVISVEDTGCGITPEQSEKVFEHLYQADNDIDSSRKGLGLGLYICKKIVTLHGGRIWVESVLDKGSTFYVTLPIFSLQEILSPILVSQNAQDLNISLITIEVFPIKKRPLDAADDISLRLAWRITEQCLKHGIDVLLPRMTHTKVGEVFFVVTRSSSSDMENLARRIREQLANSEDVTSAGLYISVSSTTAELPPTDKSISLEQLTEIVAEHIQEMTRHAVLQFYGRRGSYGQKENPHRGRRLGSTTRSKRKTESKRL
ncbi:MAG: ATP-binding protein [Chloroflexota bacterium]|nr:ATP-binding protein [Chloroflexota bacterium]